MKKTKAELRRDNSNKKIKDMGIDCFENLPLVEDSSEVKLKSLDKICKRIIASVITIQVACDIAQGNNFEESKEFFEKILDKFDVKDALLEDELKILNGKANQQEVVGITWNYEAVWSLLWALGFVEDIEKPYTICDCRVVISTFFNCKNFEEFKSNAKLKDIEEILDMLDLYYRYHWATTEKLHFNKDISIGKLHPDVVWERRKGLEWLISKEEDWQNISLDT